MQSGTGDLEKRVAATPASIATLQKEGYNVVAAPAASAESAADEAVPNLQKLLNENATFSCQAVALTRSKVVQATKMQFSCPKFHKLLVFLSLLLFILFQVWDLQLRILRRSPGFQKSDCSGSEMCFRTRVRCCGSCCAGIFRSLG